MKRSSGTPSSVRIVKLPLNNYILHNFDHNIDLFRVRYNENTTIKHKNIPNTNYFTFKQKRYKLRNKVYHKEPLSKYLEARLWELRIKAGNDNLRIIYTFAKGQVIIILHVFIKKKQKIPVGELELARKRLKEIKLKEAN